MFEMYGPWDDYNPFDYYDDPDSGWERGEYLRYLCERYDRGEWLPDHEFRYIMRSAHNAVYRALKSGKLKKQPCEKCGSTDRVQAHHPSYRRENWLAVRWLCWRCHAKVEGRQIKVRKGMNK